MICKNCNNENIIKAEYCKHCGSPFTREERDAAYKRTIFGKIENITAKWDKLISVVNLSFITGNPIFKYGLLAAILVFGLFSGRPDSNTMTVLESNDYSVQQNINNGEYYILTENNAVALNLYLPQQADSLNIQQLDENGFILSDFWFAPEDSITLNAGTENYYYITALYGDADETIKLYVVME